MRLFVKRWLAGGVGILIALGFFVFVSGWPTQLLQFPLIRNEAPRQSDVIIVLGAGTRGGVDPLPVQAKDRLARGAELVAENFASSIIVTGGLSARTHHIEADIMAPYLEQRSISASNIIREPQARDTYENALYSKKIMENHEWKTALVVTSPYHTFRSCRVFRALDIDVRCVAAPLNDRGVLKERILNLRSVIREYGAIVYYTVRGKL